MFRIYVISQNKEASKDWFRDLKQMYKAEFGTDELWEATIAPRAPNQEPVGYDLICIDAYGGRSASEGGMRSISAHERLNILELCARVRNITDMVILLIAPERNDMFAVQAYEAGVDEYISTPVSALILLAKLRSWARWTTAAFATPNT